MIVFNLLQTKTLGNKTSVFIIFKSEQAYDNKSSNVKVNK